jgi:hypothetical protein
VSIRPNTTPRIYVAGGSKEIDNVEVYMTRLREIGYEITFDWCAEIRNVGIANPRGVSEVDRKQWASRNKLGVARAWTFWLLIPEEFTIGAWVELGWATCNQWSRGRVIVSGDWQSSIMTSYADHRFDSHEGAFEYIEKTNI